MKRTSIELASDQGWMLEMTRVSTALSRNEKGILGQIEDKRQNAMVRKTAQSHQITMRQADLSRKTRRPGRNATAAAKYLLRGAFSGQLPRAKGCGGFTSPGPGRGKSQRGER